MPRERACPVAARTIFGRLDVPYGAPAPGEGVQPGGGGTDGPGGYIGLLPRRGYTWVLPQRVSGGLRATPE